MCARRQKWDRKLKVWIRRLQGEQDRLLHPMKPLQCSIKRMINISIICVKRTKKQKKKIYLRFYDKLPNRRHPLRTCPLLIVITTLYSSTEGVQTYRRPLFSVSLVLCRLRLNWQYSSYALVPPHSFGRT